MVVDYFFGVVDLEGKRGSVGFFVGVDMGVCVYIILVIFGYGFGFDVYLVLVCLLL